MVNSKILALLDDELSSQEATINMIASESYPQKDVLAAMGSIISNKYSEGYPGKRYYAGTKIVDEIERMAIDEAKSLFHAEHANVQPHSGTQANMAVFLSVLKPGDVILGMDLSCGGHMSHGSRFNFSGSLFKAEFYGLDETSKILDYERILRVARSVKPKIIVAGASSYPRKIDFRKFREIADDAGALLLCDIAHIAGFCAAGLHENPAPYSDFTTFTTQKSLIGPKGGVILCKKKYAEAIDKSVFPGVQGGAINGVIAAKAICLANAKSRDFADVMKRAIHISGILSGYFGSKGLQVVSGGSDNHIILLDLSSKNVSGLAVQAELEKIGILANRNLVPFDKKSPSLASGVRLGTVGLAQRGFSDADVIAIAGCIVSTILALEAGNADSIQDKNKDLVLGLCGKYPIYSFHSVKSGGGVQ